MEGKTILVTGAGGFIGGRLAQRIALDSPHTVRPLLHRFTGGGAMRLARLPVDIEQGSVTDADLMRDVMDGCDAVVHCAVGTRETIIDGTQTVIDAAIEEDVETFVHLSSAAVHGLDSEGVIREEAPFDPDTDYAEWKVAVEHDIEERIHGTHLDPVILRPFIVYGPGSQFVTEPLEAITSGAILADGGIGSVNQIYVDNLIDAVFLSLENPVAAGETFLLRDDEDLTWREYYEDLASMVGSYPPLRDVSNRQVRSQQTLQYAADNVVPPFAMLERIVGSNDVRQSVAEEMRRTPWAMGLYRRLPESVKSSIRNRVINTETDIVPEHNGGPHADEEPAYPIPTQRYALLHSSTGRVSNRKAKELLGWEPRISFDTSMERIQSWAEYVEQV